MAYPPPGLACNGLSRHILGPVKLGLRYSTVPLHAATRAKHLAVLRMAQARRYMPLQRCSLDQQDTRRGARPTQRLPGVAGRSRATGGLKLQQGVGIQRRVWWRLLNNDLIEAYLGSPQNSEKIVR